MKYLISILLIAGAAYGVDWSTDLPTFHQQVQAIKGDLIEMNEALAFATEAGRTDPAWAEYATQVLYPQVLELVVNPPPPAPAPAPAPAAAPPKPTKDVAPPVQNAVPPVDPDFAWSEDYSVFERQVALVRGLANLRSALEFSEKMKRKNELRGCQTWMDWFAISTAISPRVRDLEREMGRKAAERGRYSSGESKGWRKGNDGLPE